MQNNLHNTFFKAVCWIIFSFCIISSLFICYKTFIYGNDLGDNFVINSATAKAVSCNYKGECSSNYDYYEITAEVESKQRSELYVGYSMFKISCEDDRYCYIDIPDYIEGYSFNGLNNYLPAGKTYIYKCIVSVPKNTTTISLGYDPHDAFSHKTVESIEIEL